MTIPEIIAAAETTSNTWTGKLTNGKTQAILTIATRKEADRVATQLKKAGAEGTVERSPYKEYILRVTWQA